jgi:hypothetical protein
MATVQELDATDQLHRLDPGLDHDQFEDRFIYVSPRLKEWIENVLPGLGSSWHIEVDPQGQFDAFLEVYASGDVLTYQWQFKPLNPMGQSVWELKTADLRIFGWFHARDCFIGVCADTKDRILQYNLYPGYREEVVRFREALNLDEPKCIQGDNPNDIVSNYDLPD